MHILILSHFEDLKSHWLKNIVPQDRRNIRTEGLLADILIRSNEMQQYAGVYLLQNYSTCFGCLSHPSSGVHQTVTAASGTGRSVIARTLY